MAGESALYKKFRAEQDAADAAYKKWEQEQWDKNGAEWAKQGYTRTVDPNSSWGSTWKKNPVTGGEEIKQEEEEKQVEQVEQKKPEVKVTPPVVDETPKFSSYNDLMKQSWARQSHYGANNVWVDENGQKIADHKAHQGKKYQTFVTTGLFGDHNDLTYAYDPETGNIRRLHENWLGNIGDGWSSAGATGAVNNGGWGSLSDMLSQYGITYKKQGGTMNKVKYFSQGGSIKEQLRPLVIGVLSKDPAATEKLQQIVKQNPQIMKVVEEIAAEEQAKAQSQVTSSKWGSKLQYIKSLKFAKGGKTCPACMSKGGSADENVKVAKKDVDTKTYQKQSFAKKTELDEHRLGTETSSNKNGSYNISHKPSAQDSTEIKRNTMSEDMNKKYPKVKSKACGGSAPKAKKRYFGGWL